MKRTPIVVVAAALLALGACGGGGSKKAVSSAGDTSTTAATPTTAASDPGTTATPAAAGNGSPSGATAAPTTAKPASRGSAATTPAPSGASPSQSASTPSGGSGAGGVPAYTGKPTTQAGKYHYAVSGTSSFGAPPPGADLVVDAPSGSSQHSKLTSQTQQNGTTSTSSTDTTLDYQADGVHLVDLTTASGAGTLQFHPTPAPLIFPASLAKGSTVGPFDMTSSDGKEVATVKVTIQDVGVQVTTGDNQSHPTIQAEVDTTLKCTDATSTSCLKGTLNSTRWLGYDGLELKDHSTSNIQFGAYPFTSDTTSVADKANPS